MEDNTNKEDLRPNRGFLFPVKNKKTKGAPDIHIRFKDESGLELNIVGWERLDGNDNIYFTLEKNKF